MNTGTPAGATESTALNARIVIDHIEHLKDLGADIIEQDEDLGLAVAVLTPKQVETALQQMHGPNGCGGLDTIKVVPADKLPVALHNLDKSVLESFRTLRDKNKHYEAQDRPAFLTALKSRVADTEIETAVAQVSTDNIKHIIRWLSGAYPTRYRESAHANDHVRALKALLDVISYQNSREGDVEIELIDHADTKQKSLRARVSGAGTSIQKSEIVVLGAHLDSVVDWRNPESPAPGADDNASGAAVLLEAYTLLLKQPKRNRTVEFIWYAAEEFGGIYSLVGSRDIVSQYETQGKNVIGVLNLDMALHAGSGANVIGLVSNYTTSWLNDYVEWLNGAYVGAKIEATASRRFQSSDHESWYRRDYPVSYPFESKWSEMNPNWHTIDDVAEPHYGHAALFAKLAVAFMLDLSKNDWTHP